MSPLQFQARELGEIETFFPNLLPNTPVPELMGKSSHENAPRESKCCKSSHEQSDSDESPDETYEAEIWAVVEQQYLPRLLVLIQYMAIFF